MPDVVDYSEAQQAMVLDHLVAIAEVLGIGSESLELYVVPAGEVSTETKIKQVREKLSEWDLITKGETRGTTTPLWDIVGREIPDEDVPEKDSGLISARARAHARRLQDELKLMEE